MGKEAAGNRPVWAANEVTHIQNQWAAWNVLEQEVNYRVVSVCIKKVAGKVMVTYDVCMFTYRYIDI